MRILLIGVPGDNAVPVVGFQHFVLNLWIGIGTPSTQFPASTHQTALPLASLNSTRFARLPGNESVDVVDTLILSATPL